MACQEMCLLKSYNLGTYQLLRGLWLGAEGKGWRFHNIHAPVNPYFKRHVICKTMTRMTQSWMTHICIYMNMN